MGGRARDGGKKLLQDGLWLSEEVSGSKETKLKLEVRS